MESPAPIELLVPKLAQSIRLDKWLLEDGQSAVAGQDKTTFSRSQIQKLIEGGKMSVNGAPVKKNYKVRLGPFFFWLRPFVFCSRGGAFIEAFRQCF